MKTNKEHNVDRPELINVDKLAKLIEAHRKKAKWEKAKQTS